MTAEKNARDLVHVAAMLQAIDDASEDSAGGKEEFLADRKTQRAVMLDLIHLTESASRVSQGFRERHPSVPWALMSQMRNHGLVHEYAEVDLKGIWEFVRDDLPRLTRALKRANPRAER